MPVASGQGPRSTLIAARPPRSRTITVPSSMTCASTASPIDLARWATLGRVGVEEQVGELGGPEEHERRLVSDDDAMAGLARQLRGAPALTRHEGGRHIGGGTPADRHQPSAARAPHRGGATRSLHGPRLFLRPLARLLIEHGHPVGDLHHGDNVRALDHPEVRLGLVGSERDRRPSHHARPAERWRLHPRPAAAVRPGPCGARCGVGLGREQDQAGVRVEHDRERVVAVREAFGRSEGGPGSLRDLQLAEPQAAGSTRGATGVVVERARSAPDSDCVDSSSVRGHRCAGTEQRAIGERRQADRRTVGPDQCDIGCPFDGSLRADGRTAEHHHAHGGRLGGCPADLARREPVQVGSGVLATCLRSRLKTELGSASPAGGQDQRRAPQKRERPVWSSPRRRTAEVHGCSPPRSAGVLHGGAVHALDRVDLAGLGVDEDPGPLGAGPHPCRSDGDLRG